MPLNQTDAQPEVVDDKITFSLLGYDGRTLKGPIDSTSLFFSLPSDWELTDGATLQLDLLTFLGSSATGAIDAAFGGGLDVVFNGVMVDRVLLDRAGPQTVLLPVPQEALVSPRSDGRHQLRISLDSGEECNTAHTTTVVINGSSFFGLPHNIVKPVTDLSLLPRPIYQRSFTPDEAIIVVPDEPTTAEMAAALNVAAGFGKMTNGQLGLSLMPVSELTEGLRASFHLIAVGQASGMDWLADVALPISIGEAGFAAADAQENDGLIQMAVSPWNSAKVVLVVGGNSETAVLKAAQALSGGVVQHSGQPNVAIVNRVNPQVAAAGPVPTDRTFADLGYPLQKLDDIGKNEIGVEFFVPPGQTVTADAFLTLVVNHSALLDFNQSGLTVNLNDEVVGNARLTEDTTGLHEIEITIPGTAVRPGVNQLTLKANLIPFTPCGDLRQDSAWLIIRSESTLHLPLEPLQSKTERSIMLSQYPMPFISDPTLSQTAFVVPNNSVSAWNAAAQIAADLGYRSSGPLTNVTVAFADNVPEAVRQEKDLLIVGRPSLIPLVAELNDTLPAPFDAQTDQMNRDWLPVSYLLPSTQAAGYLQLIKAPWNEERALFFSMGNSDEGTALAAQALIDRSLRNQMTSDMAIVDGQRLFAGSRQERYRSIAEDTASGRDSRAVSVNDAVYRPAWILWALIAAVVLIVVIALVAFIGARRRA